MNLSEDVTVHRDWLLSLVPAPLNGLWVDCGCWTGTDMLHLAARSTQPRLRMLGLDGNLGAIEEAQHSTHGDSRLEFRHQSLDTALPIGDATVDVAYFVQAFLAEQTALNANGQYFYSITGFAYVGRRRNKIEL